MFLALNQSLTLSWTDKKVQEVPSAKSELNKNRGSSRVFKKDQKKANTEYYISLCFDTLWRGHKQYARIIH